MIKEIKVKEIKVFKDYSHEKVRILFSQNTRKEKERRAPFFFFFFLTVALFLFRTKEQHIAVLIFKVRNVCSQRRFSVTFCTYVNFKRISFVKLLGSLAYKLALELTVNSPLAAKRLTEYLL